MFSNEGIGTMIYANEYQQIRPAKKKDIRAIQMLTKKAVEAEELVRRTRARQSRRLWRITIIFEIDRNPVACVALHVYRRTEERRTGLPLRQPFARKSGHRPETDSIRRKQSARTGPERINHLSTQAFTYFQSKGGFIEGTTDDLPPGRREKYDQSGRNSKILVKKLKVSS